MTGMGPTRRGVLIALGATVAGGGVYAFRQRDSFDGTELTPPQVHRKALDGALILVDIRRPDEWAATGIGQGAVPLDMRRRDFIEALDALVAGDRGATVALICARGVRSDRLSARLSDAGYTNIIDVPEGMLGSGAGPGWLARDLPVRPVDRQEG